jgi:DTW domain-containing protein YfiP
MAQRRRGKPRCFGCGLNPTLCVCDRLPSVQLQTPLVVVQHVREKIKPTNTGRLLAKMVSGTPIVHFGQREPPFDTTPFERDDIDFRILFPREDAQTLARDEDGTIRPAPAPGKRLGFVLLDGTWHQCSRMARRVPVVRDFRCVALPPGPPSIWPIRRQHDARGVSTIEAAMRLLALLEGDEAIRPVRDAFEMITAHLLFLKGKLETPELPQT